jgi:hypothetical protein
MTFLVGVAVGSLFWIGVLVAFILFLKSRGVLVSTAGKPKGG